MKKKFNLEKLVKLPFFWLHQTNRNTENVWFFSDMEGPTKTYEVNLNDFTYSSFGEKQKLIYPIMFDWLKKDKQLVIIRDNEGDEQHNIYLYDIEQDIEIPISETPNAREYVCDISPDRKKFLIKSNREGQMNFYVIDVESKEVEQLTFHEQPVFGSGLWSDDDTIYYSARTSENKNNVDLWSIKLDGSDNKQLLELSEDSYDYVLDITRDGKHLLFQTNFRGFEQAGVLNLETNTITYFGDEMYTEIPAQFSRDNRRILVRRDDKIRTYPVLYDIHTKEEFIPNIPGLVYQALLKGDDRYLFYHRTDPQTPFTLALYDLVEKREIPLYKPDIGYSKEDFILPEFIKFKSFDGREIGAVIYKPEIESGKTYPAIVLAPGGPGGRLLWVFYGFAQVAVRAGFVLISPHVRGAFGYGKEFRDLILNDLGGGDSQDYIYSKKYLETLDFVDKDRIGIFGGSYGGYMTYLQLTKYAEAGWKAGSAHIGITHWKTMCDTSMPEYKFFFEGLMGEYEKNKELWEDRSPLNHIEKIKAPIQILHGINDPRCPVTEARQFRDKLVELGKTEGIDFEYFETAGEGHGVSGQEARLRDDKRVLEFFKRNL